MDIITRKEAKEQKLIRYFTGKPCKYGHLSEKLTSSATCIECLRIDSATRRREKPEQTAVIYKHYAKTHCSQMNVISMNCYNRMSIEERTEKQFILRQTNQASYLISRVKGRAKFKDMEFNITVEDIIIPEICPILGIPLMFNEGHNRNNTPSLDRIDNTKGYIKGNVCVISMRANRLKSNANIQEIKAILQYMEQHEQSNNS